MVEVRGYINDLIANEEYKDIIKDIQDKEGFLVSMIDAPILYNGKVIGVINDIDLDENAWYGVLWGNMAIDIDMCREYISSLNLIK